MMKGGGGGVWIVKVIFHCLDRFGFLSRQTLLSFVGASCPILVVEKYSRTVLLILVMIAVNLVCLRSGGATAAVRNNENLSERALKMHGRWKSTNAKDMYILDDVAERLKASSSLGI